jgi:hypothetical protein
MTGWKKIEDFLKDAEDECQVNLDDTLNKDLVDIQASRVLKKFIKEFRELFIDTELSAKEDERELKRIKGE